MNVVKNESPLRRFLEEGDRPVSAKFLLDVDFCEMFLVK